VALHAAERTRFVRGPEDFGAVLATGKVANARGELNVVCRSGSDVPVAYVAYQFGGPPWARKPENAITIREAAGSRTAIAAVLGLLLHEHSSDDLTWHCLASDAEALALAAAYGWPSEPRPFGGTNGIIDPALFWQRSEPRFRELLGDEAEAPSLDCSEGVTVSLQAKRLSLPDMSGLTRLVFGAETGESPETDAPPELARALASLFPQPLVDWGLNYV
jgi:hypothetical protein